MNRLSASVLLAAALSLSACEVGPDYRPPQTQTPAAWVSSDTTDAKAGIDQEWWQNFHDPVLIQLIDKAASGNFDIKIAEARIAEARARQSSAYAALLPSGDVKSAATREANQIAFPSSPGTSTLTPLLKKPFNIFENGFDASWEIDLFGGNRRAAEAADAQMQASEASRDDIRVSLLAEVARTYVEIRQYQAQIAIVENTLAADAKTLQIARQRVAAGDAPRLDVTQAEAALSQTKTQVPLNGNLLAQAEFSMDALLGEQPGATRRLVASCAPIPVSDKQVVLAAPAAVIAQRPDIRVAERKLAAATAQQGEAVAQFFPKISLSGFFGSLTTNSSLLLNGSSESWMGGGSLTWPILSYGNLSANLDAANAGQQEAMANYQKTVIGALSDVEKSLSAYTKQQDFLTAATTTADQDRHARDIAQERYRAGLTSFIDVLEADRTLYQAQAQLATARADSAQDLIALYKSLGGGWRKD